MSRQSFEEWGKDLADGEFAKALAALGVVVRRQSLPWPDDLDLAARVGEWTANQGKEAHVVPWSAPTSAECAAAPAAELAAAWSSNGIQLEIREPAQLDPIWLAATLGHPEVGAGSVYLRSDRASVPFVWKWPVRIAVLPSAETADFEVALASAAREPYRDWWHTLTRQVALDRNKNACDILVFPGPLAEATTALEALRAPVTAGALLVLGGLGDLETNEVATTLDRLRKPIQALTAAAVDVAAAERGERFASLVYELSHDWPLPVALQMASLEGELRLLVADRRLAERSRVSKRVEQVVERLKQVVRDRPSSPKPRAPRESAEQAKAGGGSLYGEFEEMSEADFDDWGESAGADAAPDRSGDWGSPADAEPPERPEKPAGSSRGPLIEVRPDSATARNLGMVAALYPADELADQIERAGSDLAQYGNESGMASVAAELASAVSHFEAHNATRQDRYILTQIYDRSDPKHPERIERYFRAGAEHELRVRMGPESRDWRAPSRLVPVPEELLPEDQQEHELTVIFHESKLLVAPQRGTIVLPSIGASTEAVFHLTVPEKTRRVEGRITVAYGNRILQTALLRGAVYPRKNVPEDLDEQIETQVEAIVRPGLANLDERRRFDAALVLNHDSDHVPGVTRLADDHISFVTGGDLGQEIDWFQRKLAEVAYERKSFTGGLEGEATVDLLRSLARHGRQLYKHLVVDQIGDDPLLDAELIQLVATSDAGRLPAEFVYDRKAPLNDPPAPLCPNARQALADGKCVDGCPAGADEQSVICPLGFWGLKKVLERHAHDPALARQVRRSAGEYAVQSEPAESRAPLPVLRGGQAAASQVVEKGCPGGSQRVQNALTQAVLAASPSPAATWKDWEQGIRGGHPSLLVLLVHTDLVDPDDTMQKMEIGQASWLEVADLENGAYVAAADGPGPLVLLLGCETSAPQVSVHSLVSELRRQGAAIVVSALSKIHAEHAVPVAEEFLTQLSEISSSPDETTTFGEVMCRVRRTMLSRGQPMALCLSAYGDADWKLVPDLH